MGGMSFKIFWVFENNRRLLGQASISICEIMSLKVVF